MMGRRIVDKWTVFGQEDFSFHYVPFILNECVSVFMSIELSESISSPLVVCI